MAPIFLYVAVSTNEEIFATASDLAPWFIVGGSLWDISTLIFGDSYEEGLGRLPILPRLLDFIWMTRETISFVAALLGMTSMVPAFLINSSEFNDWINYLAFTVTAHYSLMFFIFTYL